MCRILYAGNIVIKQLEHDSKLSWVEQEPGWPVAREDIVKKCSSMAPGNDAKLGDDKYDMWMISWLK